MGKHSSKKVIFGVLGAVVALGLIALSVSLQQPVRSSQRSPIPDVSQRRSIPPTRAAAEGVGARTSATKSAMVKSIS